jgi:hypothetical protein
MSLLWMIRGQSEGFSHRGERVPFSFPVAVLRERSGVNACRSRFQAVARSGLRDMTASSVQRMISPGGVEWS